MLSSPFKTETVIVTSPPVGKVPSLRMVVNRYTKESQSSEKPSSKDVSLVFVHAMGLTKEQWEPVIEKLWTVVEESPELSASYRIAEVWTPEWQTHGESGLLNASVLEREGIKGTLYQVWGAGIAAFFNAGYLKDKRVIPIGFSGGNLAILHALGHFPLETPPVAGLVITEPVLYDREISRPDDPKSMLPPSMMAKGLKAQADEWPDRETARKYLSRRPPWTTWDKRAFEIFMKHGLKDFIGPDGKPGVRTICSKYQEIMIYGTFDAGLKGADIFREQFEMTYHGMDVFERIHRVVPVHFVFGSTDRLIPKIWKSWTTDASKGRKIAGVHSVEAGHMIPQEKPDDFAKVLSELIRTILMTVPPPKL